MAKYDGSAWSELGGNDSLSADLPIEALYSDASGNIYAGGDFVDPSFLGRYVAKYDGSHWSELGGPDSLHANGTIFTICGDSSGNIYAAGDFRNGGSFAGNRYVSKYNDTVWSELGGFNALAANGYIYSICSDRLGNIYAGGIFTNGTYYYVAKYNGTSWSELSGVNHLNANDLINSICTDAAGNIYAAGRFTNSSRKAYVAKFGLLNCQVVTASQFDTLCQGDSVNVGTHAYYQAGVYTDTLTASTGCDSIVTLTLTVNSLPVVTLSWDSMVELGRFTQYWDTAYCFFPSSEILAGGKPAGGYYSGRGVSNNTIYLDAIQNLKDTVTYTYIDSNGCRNSASDGVNVNICEGINNISNNYTLSIFPNPFTVSATVTYNLPSGTKNAALIAYDVLGREAAVYKLPNPAGQLSITSANLNSGIYFYTLVADGQVLTVRKMVIE